MRRPRLLDLESTLSFDFPTIVDISLPSVTLHKKGKFVLFKADHAIAADVLEEVNARYASHSMRDSRFYLPESVLKEKPHLRDIMDTPIKKLEIWKHLEGHINEHPYCEILRSYGIEVGTSPTLQNYILRESRRRRLEATGYPAPAIDNNEVSLFDRCSPGTNLRCIRDFAIPDSALSFKQGKRYMVVRAKNEGIDKVGICIDPISRGAALTATGNGRIHDWSELDPPMEDWFDDSENVDFGPTRREVYPERVAAMEKKMESLPFIQKKLAEDSKHPLYRHVREDVPMAALDRSITYLYLMRMGKSSAAITTSELWGSNTVAVIGSNNVRMAWRREFKRLGIEDYTLVDSWADVEKPVKYYLFNIDWLKAIKDPSERERKDSTNLLRPAFRTVNRKVDWTSISSPITVFQYNPCPHCACPLERPLQEEVEGKRETRWTQEKGYLCRNPDCTYVTDNRAFELVGKRNKQIPHKSGAAWATDSSAPPHVHRAGSFIDLGLARHAQCSGNRIKGRMCQECGLVDSVWTPPRYRRIHKRFNASWIDEVHNCKSDDTLNARAAFAFRSKRRGILTGTLLSNCPTDAFCPLEWVQARQSLEFPWRGKAGKKAFENRFCDFAYLEKPTGEIDPDTGEEIVKIVRKRTPFLINPPEWWRMTNSKVIRRNYQDPLFQQALLEAGMKQPTPVIQKVTVPMHPAQAALMLDALRDFQKQYAELEAQAEENHHEVNKALVIAKMSSLRMIATSPERINQKLGYEAYKGPAGGGKMQVILDLVKQSTAEGKKVLILSDFVEMQRSMDIALAAYKPVRLLSSWGMERRDEAISEFMDNPERMVFISGTRLVREAVDLSAADVTICTDLLWSFPQQTQAWSRGMAPTVRERTCTVYLLLSENSLDEHQYNVFYSKMVGSEQALDRKVVNRRAMDFDIKFFAQRVLEEEAALSIQARDFQEGGMIYVPGLEVFSERSA